MYRMPRALTLGSRPFVRPVETTSRLPTFIQQRAKSRWIWRSGQQPIRAHEVRFTNPSIFKHRRRLYTRAVTWTLYLGAAYVVFRFLSDVVEIEVEYVEHDDEEGEGNDKAQAKDAKEDTPDSLVADEDAWFIPMTFATKMPKQYYRYSDPEWQEFIKISRDRKRQDQVREDLVNLCQKNLTKHPFVARVVGKNPKTVLCWSDVSFPEGPPQEYERGGLEIGDDYIAWSRQRIDADTHSRVARGLWPRNTFNSLMATQQLLIGIEYRRIMQALGWAGRDPMSPEERFKVMKANAQARERKTVDGAQTDPQGSAGPSLSGASATDGSSRSENSSADQTPWYLRLVTPKPASPENELANIVFRHNMAKGRAAQGPKEVPRGSFLLQGTFQIKGESGTVYLDVHSSYDPKASKFVDVRATVRSSKPARQVAKGGP